MSNTVPASHLEQIPASKLVIDERVQRIVDPVRVKREGKRFNPMGTGVLIVSRRDDGTDHLIDGGHRQAFAIEAGQPDFPFDAKVWTGLSLEDEAAMFMVHNNTRTVPPTAKHRIAVIEGDVRATSIDTILHNAAWRVDQKKGPGICMAVNTLYQIYDLANERIATGYGNLVIARLFKVITAAWGHDANGVTATLIGGIGRVLIRHYDEVEDSRMIQKLAAEPGHGTGLAGKARGLQQLIPGTLMDACAAMVIRVYNGERKSPKTALPEWQRL